MNLPLYAVHYADASCVTDIGIHVLVGDVGE